MNILERVGKRYRRRLAESVPKEAKRERVAQAKVGVFATGQNNGGESGTPERQ